MKTKNLSLIVLCIFFLSACNLPASMTGASSGTVVIVSPPDGTHLNVGDTVDILSQMSDSSATSISLIVNDEVYRRDDLDTPLGAGSLYQPWTPTAVGTYAILVRVSSADGELDSNKITVIVGEGSAATLPPPVNVVPTNTLLPDITPSVTPPPVVSTHTPTVTAAPPTATSTATILANGSISGKVFRDENGSGSLNLADVPLAGITVQLGSGACPSSGLQITQTAGDGKYTFASLAAGQYCVAVDTGSLPSIGGTWQPSLPNSRSVTLGVSESQTWNFMFQPIIQ